ncbi:MAG: PhoU domain-containing protein, partial [Desulfobacterium sp.]|nr:PhoU domain-containing protein [Desulfobacterium sp.]
NPFCYDYSSMAEKTGLMLKMSLDALVGMDSDMADQVIRMDKDVNAMRNRAYESMKTAIIKAPDLVEQTINRYLISRHLERIGDHATNIAEEVIHLIDGKIVRHSI